MTTIFEPLRVALIARDYDLADVFECIANFAGAQGQGFVGAAMGLHARDIFCEKENAEFAQPSAFLAEIYRRTFFDPVTAALYGTEMYAAMSDAQLQEFVQYVTQSLGMDDAQSACGFPSTFDMSKPN